MSVTVVIGTQYGDEGKGKIIDYLAQKSDMCIRFHGGNNAGHTVINEWGKFPMHLIPCGVFNRDIPVVITNGAVIDLACLVEEIELLEKAHIPLTGRLLISPNCHLIMPYHKILDAVYEEIRGEHMIGTTKRGIGPCYADKVSYNGLRLADMVDGSFFMRLMMQLRIKNPILTAFGQPILDGNWIGEEQIKLFEKISKYVVEPTILINDQINKGRRILVEGAHGHFLDPDWGDYPFVTASSIAPGGITAGAGIPANRIDDIIGVTKAYSTRVGRGPFPTEMSDGDFNIGERLVVAGNEFGTTTGRKRRIGWLDIDMLNRAIKINGINSLAITKLDVFDGFKQIKVLYNNTYLTYGGWDRSRGITEITKLPYNARLFVESIERLTNSWVSLIGTGSGREEIVCLFY
jgi:adenylosuccinate synthase